MGGPDFSDQDKLNIRNKIVLEHSADLNTDFKTIKIRDMRGNDRILLSVKDATTLVGVPDTASSSLVFSDKDGNATIKLGDSTSDRGRELVIRDRSRTQSFDFISGDDNHGSRLWVGAIKSDSPIKHKAKPGFINIRDGVGNGSDSIVLDGANRGILLRDASLRDSIILDGAHGDLSLTDNQRHHSFTVHGNIGGFTGLWLGANVDEGGKAGKIFLRDDGGKESIELDGSHGANGELSIKDKDGTRQLNFRSAFQNNSARLWIGSVADGDGPNTIPGYVHVRDGRGGDSIVLDGLVGNVLLPNADCAEEFDMSVSELREIEPGTVMVISNDGKLQPSTKAYDKKVAGVISGAGDYKPGIILDAKQSQKLRAPLAMLGKAYCKVDASYSQIGVGDMLTTSPTAGHAMKATNRSKAFGAIIGKTLSQLVSGQGLIPILIALQ